MISVRAVRKCFGRTVALCDVSFEIGEGEIVGLLGPNGAGKTTLLRIITGFVPADSGQVQVAGAIGYLPEAAPAYREMRVEAYLRFRAQIKRIARSEVAGRVERAMDRVELTARRSSVIGTLSRGYRQRLGLADALVAEPPVLILDEPTVGLDPVQVREFRQLLVELAEHHTVLLSTHQLMELESVTSRIVVLVAGAVAADGSPAQLRGEGSLEDAFVALAQGGRR